ncbi:hypothetical protein PV327_011576 [Microctonus hyperodae]|uniref:Uncharacterized protein n=1 Tax=Microctonus hyperodae TaxID=165561 RepID=A0AA39C2K8_MICHY|nr:hypothetical protein PV327_011576 [Microctonus hyperodae]
MAGTVIAEELDLLEGYGEFKNILPFDIDDTVFCVSWVELNGTTYRNGMYLSTRSKDYKIMFNKIQHVLIVNADTITFLCLQVNIITFSQHFQSFEIEDTDRWTYVVQKKLTDVSSLNRHMMPNGKYYIPLVL